MFQVEMRLASTKKKRKKVYFEWSYDCWINNKFKFKFIINNKFWCRHRRRHRVGWLTGCQLSAVYSFACTVTVAQSIVEYLWTMWTARWLRMRQRLRQSIENERWHYVDAANVDDELYLMISSQQIIIMMFICIFIDSGINRCVGCKFNIG